MTILIEKGNPCFDIDIARKNFAINRENLDDVNGFEQVFANSRFFNVYNYGYVGSVFVYQGIDDKYYIGGYARRKCHKDVVNAIRQVSSLFECVYAHTRHPNAVIALKKAGFDWQDRKRGILVKINLK